MKNMLFNDYLSKIYNLCISDCEKRYDDYMFELELDSISSPMQNIGIIRNIQENIDTSKFNDKTYSDALLNQYLNELLKLFDLENEIFFLIDATNYVLRNNEYNTDDINLVKHFNKNLFEYIETTVQKQPLVIHLIHEEFEELC